jgi:hypothetical protein
MIDSTTRGGNASRPTGRITGLLVAAGCILLAAGIEAGQRGWVLAFKPSAISQSSAVSRALSVRADASIGADANGLYCTPLTDNAAGVHDLGSLPAGLRVSVVVEGLGPDQFNPVAAVVVALLGDSAANTVKPTTFYDDDSGGDGDPRLEFVTPHAGNYILLVADKTDAVAGCYRYQMIVS